ncbi:MAG TPA: sulfite exporter TauE/SafE family protein [Solirubrobacteraceae bacterium]|nr:sulfite exporter TauE/SafE family protein [Solirubrobacteraceae bacterium]
MDPVIIIFGFAIGALIGVTGMGGASLMTPLLILVFGVQPVTAVGTDIFYGAVTKTVGGWRHLRQGTVHRAIAFWLAVGAIPATAAGVWLIEFIQRQYGEEELNQLVLGALGAALLVVGVATLLRSLFFADVLPERHAMHLYRRHIIAAVVTGVITGFIIGLTSAGGGTFVAIALITIFRLTPQRVVGTSIFQAAVVLWAAGIAHWIGGNIDFGLAGNILLGSVPGVIVGSHISVRIPQGVLRNSLGVVLCGSAVALITKEQVPQSILLPSLALATVAIAALFGYQIYLHRQLRTNGREAAAPAKAG